MTQAFEQRNPYKGSPQRPWIRIRLREMGGVEHEVQLLADTGNPCAIILGMDLLEKLKILEEGTFNSNFGVLVRAWINVHTPELGLDLDVPAYGSDNVLAVAKASSPDFEGLAGLPLLRLMEYGGDADSFWVRPLAPKP